MVPHVPRNGWSRALKPARLVCLTAALREVFPEPEAVVARLGGEEFAVLLPDALAGEAWTRGEAVHASLGMADAHASGPPVLRGSGGVAGFHASSHAGADDLLRALGRALYRAKGEGRDRIFPADRAAPACG